MNQESILDGQLSELAALDRTLKQTALGDVEALSKHVERRTALVQAAAAEIARLRQAGSVPPVSTRAALERSMSDGMQSIRQIILAKHMLATELGRLKQEQRLLDALADQESPVHGSVEISA